MIRLFIGADGQNCDLESQAVAEYTARKYSSLPLEITWMQQAAKGHWRGWACGSGRTPFSHFRWSIPAVCGYEGRAIYTDSDFLFRADLAELWNQPIPGVLLLRNPAGKFRTCCMLIDCARAKGHFPDLDELRALADPSGAMHGYFREHRELISAYEGDWNCIDLKGYEDINDPRIKAIHMSRMECQPHLPMAIPRLAAEGRYHWYSGEVRRHWREDLIGLFNTEYDAAITAGYTLERYRVKPFDGSTRRDFKYSSHLGSAQ